MLFHWDEILRCWRDYGNIITHPLPLFISLFFFFFFHTILLMGTCRFQIFSTTNPHSPPPPSQFPPLPLRTLFDRSDPSDSSILVLLDSLLGYPDTSPMKLTSSRMLRHFMSSKSSSMLIVVQLLYAPTFFDLFQFQEREDHPFSSLHPARWSTRSGRISPFFSYPSRVVVYSYIYTWSFFLLLCRSPLCCFYFKLQCSNYLSLFLSPLLFL